jgi:hypothetical protein
VKRLAGAKARAAAVRDVQWVLVNAKEFQRVHGLDTGAVGSSPFLNAVSAAWDKKEGRLPGQ